MKIVVIGGSGLIGSRLVNHLHARGHEAVAASPNSGVNTLTGEGLAQALEGASVVVDVSNSPSFEEAAATAFFETSTRHLLTHEVAAGVGHHVALSVVGANRLSGSGYMRAKVAQEKLIEESPIPYTIIHSTQFFEFFKRIADDATQGDMVQLAPVLIQPISADDVARAIGEIAVGTPVKGTVEIAGPERLRFDSFIRQGLRAINDPRQVVADPKALYFGAELSERTLVAGDGARLGETRFEDWVQKPGHLAPISSPPTAAVAAAPTEHTALKDNEFRLSDVPPGSALLVAGVVAVFNVAGTFYATQNECTHARGPLCEGKLDGSTVTCPWHGSQFNVSTGAVVLGPARDVLQTYRVTVEGKIGRVKPD